MSVARLKVPPKAREEFQRACDASNNYKLEEAEQHARAALDKFQSYSAGWVMLGLILERENKAHEALDACDRASTFDSNYLPAYLCSAEFSVRSKNWGEVLNFAGAALALKSEGDAYSYYYRATAYLHMNDLAEAKKSALQAAEIDVKHFEPSLYLLLAQIYSLEGDNENAIAQLQELLKHPADRQRQDAARQLLAKLESQPSTK